MQYSLELNPRPFEAIQKGIKKIECRVPTDHNKDISFDKLKKGDLIRFTNNITKEKMNVRVLGIRHYSSFRDLLESEGTEGVLSSGGNVEEGIKSFENFSGYKEGVKKQGVYAIEIKRVDASK